jgi:hypothetical protein
VAANLANGHESTKNNSRTLRPFAANRNKKRPFRAVCIQKQIKSALRATHCVSRKSYDHNNSLSAACGHAATENALKAIFVNHRSNRILAFFVQGAHHASGAIHLNIGIGSQNGSGQNNAEANHRSHAKQAFGMKKHAAG